MLLMVAFAQAQDDVNVVVPIADQDAAPPAATQPPAAAEPTSVPASAPAEAPEDTTPPVIESAPHDRPDPTDDGGPSAQDLFDELDEATRDSAPAGMVQDPADNPAGDVVPPSMLPESDNDALLVGQEGEQAVPVTDSQAAIEQAQAAAGQPEVPPLPQAWTTLHSQPCTIQVDPATQWVLLIFQAKAGEDRVPPPCWALPNAVLEEMERIAALDPSTVFHVTGDNTVYNNRPFFMVRRAGTESDFDPHQTEDDLPAPGEPGEDGAQPGEMTSDDVLDRLLDDDPAAPVIPPADEPYTDREQPDGVAPEIASQEVQHPGRGQLVVDREAMILPTGEGQWRELVFAGDNHGHEPPLRLLPCILLAEADRRCAARPRESMRFSISGEIVEYRGQRYLLLNKLLPLRDMGQF
jgi:hypothetical protein